MIKITDRTLMTMDECLPSKEALIEFCTLISKVGIYKIELSSLAYEKMGFLPEGARYVLHLKDTVKIPNEYKFLELSARYSERNIGENIIHEFQINDIREVHLLRQFSNLQKARIIGLDDIMCYDYISIFNSIKSIFSSNVELCPENDYNCATAIATQWLLSGAEAVTSSFCGIGGYAATEEIVIALRIVSRYKPNLDLAILQELKSLFEDMTKTKIHDNKPVLGAKIFTVEAGVHADGLLKNPITYEPYDPEIIGVEREIVVGKHSGTKAVKMKLENLGYSPSNLELKSIMQKVQEKSIDLGRGIDNSELINIAKEVVERERE